MPSPGKVISVLVDEETRLQLDVALARMAQTMGVDRVTISVVLRDVINKIIQNPTPPFDLGWIEGYRAAYGACMHSVQKALAEIIQAPPEMRRGLGIGSVLPDGIDRDGDGG